ncbi:MAG: glucuronate isomerase [Armatimonadetes bacterium]|nr:glucuronate isomerase [Armatimonadota bacterium]
MPTALSRDQIRPTVERLVAATPVFDIHTHLYAAPFGDLLLWGPDELITYHYLIAEVCRTDRSLTPEAFFALPKAQQAAHIWQKLFLDNSPLSEARRGVLTALSALGADVGSKCWDTIRARFAGVTVEQHIDRVFAAANCSGVVMTNDPLDDAERAVWERGFDPDPRFRAALRLDGLLVFLERNVQRLSQMGYDIAPPLTESHLGEARRFLQDWIARMDPMYMAVSLPDTFRFPEDSVTGKLIAEAVVPVARETGVPFALMIGVKRQINPGLRLAGDGVGRADVGAVERLCAENPDVKFLATLLSLENQHQLAVAARKFPNLMVFGCWWFLNNPSLIEQITRMRLELLGTSMVPQHSDCRILDQLVYKWAHSRPIIAACLAEKYELAAQAGWPVTEDEIARDVRKVLSESFLEFVDRG